MASIKLTPALKQLLALRNPNVLPSPPLAQLNRVFTHTLRDARAKKAETGWLVASTCTLLTANRPSAVGHLYRFATRSSLEEDKQTSLDLPSAINKAALMRESALKSTIFIGVPRVILSLAALHEALDDDVKKALRTHSRRNASPDNIESIVTRGRSLWDGIYVPHADKLHDKLGSYHPDFIWSDDPHLPPILPRFIALFVHEYELIGSFNLAFIIQAYGSVLSPLPGETRAFSDASGSEDRDQGNLSRAMGSVVGMAALRAEGGVGPQLISHTFGLLKARLVENQCAEDQWLSSDEGTEWILRTVDYILDGVADGANADQAKAKL